MKSPDKKGKISADALLKKLRPYLEEKSIAQEIPQSEEAPEVKEETTTLTENTSLEEVPEVEEEIVPLYDFEDEPLPVEEEKSPDGEEANYNLMSIFGVDDREIDDGEEQYEEPKKRRLVAKEVDLSDKAQKKEFRAKYVKRYAGGTLGLIVIGVLLLFTLLCESLSALGLALPALFDVRTYTEAALWMSLQIVVLAVALQFKVIIRSVRELTYGQITAGGVFAIYSVVMALYYILLLVFKVRTDVATYNSVYLFAALISLICEMFDVQSVLLSMEIASSEKGKRVLVEPDKKLMENAKALVGKYLPENTPYLMCTEGMKVTDFSQRWTDRNSKRKLTGLMLIISLSVALILGFINIKGEGFYGAVKCTLSTLWFLAPLPLCFSFSHPIFVQNKKLHENGATVIGERSFEQYKAPACLIINDKDMFSGKGSVQLSGIQGYVDSKLELALGYAAAVFTKLDCPLGKVFTDAASDYNISEDVDIAFVSDNGIEGAVEGIPVLVGNYSFIEKHGILPEGESYIYENDDCYIYIAVENETCLRVQLTYTPSREFERTLRALLGRHVNVIIRTCDPNINMKLLERLMDIDSIMPIRIMRIKDSEDAKYSSEECCATGIVTTGGLRTIAGAFGGIGRVSGAVIGGIAVSVALTLVAIAIIVAMSLTTGFSGVISPLLPVYQLIWCLPVLLIDKILL